MAKIQAYVPDEIQDVATAIIEATGLTVSDAVCMFMTRVATDRALPLSLFQPSSESERALRNAKDGKLTRTTLDGIRSLIRDEDDRNDSKTALHRA